MWFLDQVLVFSRITYFLQFTVDLPFEVSSTATAKPSIIQVKLFIKVWTLPILADLQEKKNDILSP